MDWLLNDTALLLSVLYSVGVPVGAVGNWTAKWLKNEVACVFDMARTEVKATVYAICAHMGAGYLVLASGAVDLLTLKQALIAGVAFGWAIDSAVNKGRRESWPEHKRQAEREKAEIKGST